MRNPFKRQEARSDPAISIDEWVSYFNYAGHQYPFGLQYSAPGEKQERIGANFSQLVSGAYKSDGIVFACMMCRQLIFSEARLQYRRRSGPRRGELWGSPELQVFETPWPGGTTGDLLARMIQDADLAGNAFVYRQANQLYRLRPDWTTIVLGSTEDPNVAADDLLADLIGYRYKPGGEMSQTPALFLTADEVAHFAPIPDPHAHYRGMSWLEPIIREIMGDKAMTSHRLKFFENGATPNLAVIAHPDIKDDQEFDAYVKRLRERNEGLDNAYKTLILGGNTQVIPVGVDLQQLDFKVTQGAGETRIAAAAGAHPVIVGLSEGLQGASLNAGNFSAARRRFADGTMRPLWRNAAGSLARLVAVPSDSELWYDARDIAFLMDDEADRAKVQQTDAITIKTLTDAGFEPKTVVDAVMANDLSRLANAHSGLFSVQLQPPGTEMPSTNGKPDALVPA